MHQRRKYKTCSRRLCLCLFLQFIFGTLVTTFFPRRPDLEPNTLQNGYYISCFKLITNSCLFSQSVKILSVSVLLSNSSNAILSVNSIGTAFVLILECSFHRVNFCTNKMFQLSRQMVSNIIGIFFKNMASLPIFAELPFWRFQMNDKNCTKQKIPNRI